MPIYSGNLRLLLILTVASVFIAATHGSPADPPDKGAAETMATRPSLAELKKSGLQRSRFNAAVKENADRQEIESVPQPNLTEFAASIKPLLDHHCLDCHGAAQAEGNVRIDKLNPDLLRGGDTDWWVEVFAVVTKGEMPPPDSSELTSAERQQIVDWLSNELQAASKLHRNSGARTSFRRLTRYEYNHALQDLLGLPWDFAKDLPPEPHTAEGFENSAELLHLSASQFEAYHRLARQALARAIIVGDRPPTLQWNISMQAAADREWPRQTEQLEKAKQDLANQPTKLEAELARLEASFRQPHREAHYKELSTGRTAPARWEYYGAGFAFAPSNDMPPMPPPSIASPCSRPKATGTSSSS